MSEFVQVGNFFSRMEAEMNRVLLEDSGVAAWVSADDGGAMNPALLTGAGGARLLVRAEDAERAIALLLAPADGAEDGGGQK